MNVPEPDEVDRHVTADAGPPCQARLPTALKDKVAKLVCSVVQNPTRHRQERTPRVLQVAPVPAERTQQIPSLREKPVAMDAAKRLLRSARGSGKLFPKLHLHFDALKMSGLTICGANVTDSALSCKGLLS